MTERQIIITLAEKVMGWKVQEIKSDPRFYDLCPKDRSRYVNWDDPDCVGGNGRSWNPLKSLADAWMVVEQMRERFGAEFLLAHNRTADTRAKFTQPRDFGWCMGASPSLAICHAALKAMEIEIK